LNKLAFFILVLSYAWIYAYFNMSIDRQILFPIDTAHWHIRTHRRTHTDAHTTEARKSIRTPDTHTSCNYHTE